MMYPKPMYENFSSRLQSICNIEQFRQPRVVFLIDKCDICTFCNRIGFERIRICKYNKMMIVYIKIFFYKINIWGNELI